MKTNKVIHPLKPIVDKESKVLILGSFPSVLSREKSFYYANPTNRFWKVLEGIYHEPINNRVNFCMKHHIALWDVIHSCEIKGSNDNSIQNVKCNNIKQLIQDTNIQVRRYKYGKYN